MYVLFNDNWQFAKIHIDDVDSPLPDFAGLIADKSLQYADVEIPHDWLIWNTNDLYENSIGIYQKHFEVSEADDKENFSDNLSGDLSAQRHYLRFDGVYMDSTVFVNGEKAFVWKYGYTTFEVDISRFLKVGDNLIQVVVVYRNPNTRWYSGAGIYRNVWLRTVPQTHLVADGVYVSNRKMTRGFESSHNADSAQSSEKSTSTGADCAVHSANTESAYEWECFYQVEVVSHGKPAEVTVKATLLSADGAETASGTAADPAKEIATQEQRISVPAADTSQDMYYFLKAESPVPQKTESGYATIPPETTGAAPKIAVCRGQLNLRNIHLWNTDDPYLYTLKIELFDENGALLDSCTQKTGFRTIEYNADKGFFLNGRHIKIHGACLHHDLGCLGSAFNKSALKRQFKKMFEMGVNSIRTSHNPPAPEFLELADEMGMLIDCECFDQWERSKTKFDYSNYFKEYHALDVASWIRRDRNHPCIIMWSIGNEIYDTHLGTGRAIAKDLTALVHTYDFKMNAPVTIGSNYIEWENAQECMKEVDLAGYNYAERLYEAHHKKYPDWKIYGSETSSTVQSRGIYHFPADFRILTHDDQQCSCLGNCSSNWGSINTTMAIVPDRDAEFCIGQYIWTGWDYIGEPTPYFTKNSYFGQIDTAGFKKDTFYLYQAEWTDYHKTPMVHLLPYWDFNENQIIDVKAYTNAPIVELFFNGKTCGKQTIDHAHGKVLEGHWKLPYKHGTIRAVAYDEAGKVVAEDKKSSFGDPAKLVLNYEREDNLIFVDISTIDKDGNPVENARNRVDVRVEGGRLLGLDNGDSTDYEQYKCSSRKLFNNHLIAVVELQPDERKATTQIGADFATSEENSEAVRITAISKDLEPAELVIRGDGSVDGNPHVSLLDVLAVPPVSDEVPVRKIELLPQGSLALSAESPSVTVKARILPENATFRTLEWKPCRIEGVKTSCAKVEVSPDGLSARLSAAGDGNFRLRCTASNGKPHPDVVSEIEFSVTGMGTGTLNPYQLISACECTASLNEPKQSFQGGVFLPAERNWLMFENVDFGADGSDEFSVPIFAFEDKLPLELWDGNPDDDGIKLLSCEYSAKSWYNHYQANTWKLPRRLTGVHNISLVFTTRLSVQGIQFVESAKAFSKLYAADTDRITGDAFTRENDSITGIGNNVSLEFSNMDFGADGTTGIKIEGRAVNGTNTVHIKFSPIDAGVGAGVGSHEDSEQTETAENAGIAARILIAEIPQSNEIKKHTISFTAQLKGSERITGKQNVTFVFLPGSYFDFKSFKFER